MAWMNDLKELFRSMPGFSQKEILATHKISDVIESTNKIEPWIDFE